MLIIADQQKKAIAARAAIAEILAFRYEAAEASPTCELGARTPVVKILVLAGRMLSAWLSPGMTVL